MNRAEFIKRLETGPLILDGSYGAQFFKRGFGDVLGEELNLIKPDVVLSLQKEYVDAGCDILLTNTFNANRMKLTSHGLEQEIEEINKKGVLIAREASGKNTLVFGDISSTGEFPVPVGKADSQTVYETFYEQASILDKYGVDGFIIETMTDFKETKLAVLAIRDVNREKPLIVQMTFDLNENEEPRSVTGTPVSVFANLMNDMDVDVVGINCSLGPKEIFNVFSELRRYTEKPISVEPNAGDPFLENGRLFYKMSADEFAVYASDIVMEGAGIIGGCCGTGPEHISALKELVLKNPSYTYDEAKKRASGDFKQETEQVYFSSRTKLIQLSPFMPIGERINPASRKRFQEEIERMDYHRIVSIAKEQEAEGAKLLDLNLGIEKILAQDHFNQAVIELDRISSNPLSFDIQTTKYLYRALDEYAGRPLINSARVTEKSIEKKAEILKRHGGVLILLAMGKKIPTTAEERVQVILEGINWLDELGISANRIIADPLVLSLGAGNDPEVTLKTVQALTALGINTTMGLSNLSFGMPLRSGINAAFLSRAIERGLSSAIMNTGDLELFGVMQGSLSLKGEKYENDEKINTENEITEYLLNGQSEKINTVIDVELKTKSPLEISQETLGAAMNEIGVLYGKKEIHLPQLILAAETSKPVFDRLNDLSGKSIKSIGKVLVATVEGDVHDIGKKIVGTVLSSGGFEVIDLGKDCKSEDILEAVSRERPDILGLSAMMTTTVGRVQEVKQLLMEKRIEVKLISGGASMNRKLAEDFGCDGYSRDATGALELCKDLVKDKPK
ncbi:MAG TPA: homocysteine S-methyltransferase family protein [Thermotogota bacterium]|nr:homocysteine S-methyltransferase family protein [Thermotogota bacterium]HPJ87600.1 homocysteine S-methyltransferase family protein [Thermotogota bacterium]HPR94805.1 homocysteine S-methyltransferase family protein [Thermotogota bacterium]